MDTNNHVCFTCAYKKRTIEGIVVSDEDNEVFERINLMQSNAQQACRPDSIPADIPQERAAAYFQGALANKISIDVLFSDWWKRMLATHSIPQTAKYDNVSKTFYECVDSDGSAAFDGNWAPRESESKE